MGALRNIASTVLTLILVSFLTFVLADLQVDRATTSAAAMRGTVEQRAEAASVLRERLGFVDPDTGERRSSPERYLGWLGRLVRLEVAPPGEPERAFRKRILRAAMVSASLGLAAYLLAVGLGAPLGVFLARHRGRLFELSISASVLTLTAVPSFVLATVLLLVVGVGLGLDWPVVFAVVTLAAAPFAGVVRLVRASAIALERAPFVEHLRRSGATEREVGRSLRRHSFGPVRSQSAAWLPGLITGSLVVEEVFGLPGLGGVLVQSVRERDTPTILLISTFAATVVCVAWSLTEAWQKAEDPRYGDGVG